MAKTISDGAGIRKVASWLKRKGQMLVPLLLGQGLCSGKTFGVTLGLALVVAGPVLTLAVFLMASFLGRGPGPGQQTLMDLAMFGAAAALSLLVWIVLGQALRRIRSTGQLWLALCLVLAVPYPIILIPLGFALSIWPARNSRARCVEPKLWHGVMLAVFGVLIALAIVGLSCGVLLAIWEGLGQT